ncbi:CLUMA_CG015601, isoform A [Clunio marinus]|uniref:CLUMA_CG015601, isoform A n=1 Tax=Clunio marinus TaxID=568069 RepID=A0A1J1IP32_9DIPT|nr:CLUMA_CG015601, isoform A [Clunio marinus]
MFASHEFKYLLMSNSTKSDLDSKNEKLLSNAIKIRWRFYSKDCVQNKMFIKKFIWKLESNLRMLKVISLTNVMRRERNVILNTGKRTHNHI